MARIGLVMLLLATHVATRFVTPLTDYTYVFFLWGALHGHLCLALAAFWLAPRAWRVKGAVWGGIGVVLTVLSMTRLFFGLQFPSVAAPSLAEGVRLLAPAGVLMAILFAFLPRMTLPRTAVRDGNVDRRWRLRDLFGVISACGMGSWIVHQLISSPNGWFLDVQPLNLNGSPVPALGLQSLVTGMLLPPVLASVLRPRWRQLFWIPYFVVVCAVEPVLQSQLAHALNPARAAAAATPPQDYLAIVVDNLTWYGMFLIPIAVFAVLLRLAEWRAVPHGVEESLPARQTD